MKSEKKTKKSKAISKSSEEEIVVSVEKPIEEKSPKKKSQKEPTSMEELLSQTGYLLHGYRRGQLIEGTVVSISPKEVLIDVGGKTEGIVGEKDMEVLRDLLSDLHVGQKVNCVVIMTENEIGQMVVSLRKAGMDLRWKKMEERMNNKEPVEVSGLEVNKGGLIVTVEGLRGFIPSSQLASVHGDKVSELINRRISVLVIEVNQPQNRLIFSEKKLSGKEVSSEKKEALSKISIGESYEGVVSGVVPYGLFVNIDGIDGLVHISEIAWEKVNSPGDYFKAGDKIKVMVLGIDEKAGKLNLSVKQLTPDPWEKVASHYSTNQAISGKVSRVSPFGVFITLEPGIEGLIHISKIPPGKEFQTGEKVECTIESVDASKRRISLALVLTAKPVGYK